MTRSTILAAAICLTLAGQALGQTSSACHFRVSASPTLTGLSQLDGKDHREA